MRAYSIDLRERVLMDWDAGLKRSRSRISIVFAGMGEGSCVVNEKQRAILRRGVARQAPSPVTFRLTGLFCDSVR